ncbi:MAG: haloacid dehalogenase [Acidimicrobiia bacterium]
MDIDIEDSKSIFESQHNARESMLVTSRKIIQLASSSIRSSHRSEFEKAQKLNEEGKQLVELCGNELEKFPTIAANSMYYDAQKEYTESCCVLNILRGESIPTRDELNVEPAAYINGLVEAASEMRRSVLDALKNDDVDQANKLLEIMDDVYTMAISIDFPDAITHGLRRTTDAFRAVLERTRGDVTTAIVFLRARK